MEHHFHTAVLLGLEGLIEIGTVGEISAAMGDKERRIDLLLLNQLGQGFEITFYVRLAAAQREAFLDDRAHVDRNWTAIDAGYRHDAARPHRLDGLVEN